MNESIQNVLYDPVVGRIVTAVIGLLVVIALVRLAQRSIGRYVKETQTRYRARKFTHFIGYLLAIVMLATVFSDKLGGLTVALGVAGAGIAFALQEVIASVAGWFAISFANFYKTGDRVQLGGIQGDIIDIGMLRTTLMETGQWIKGDLYNGRVVRIANSFVFKEPVFNYSGEFPFLWDEITVPVHYGSDYRMAREILEKIVNEVTGEYAQTVKAAWQDLVNKYLVEDARVEPMVTMSADENWMTFTLRYVVDFKKRRTIKDALFWRIITAFDATQGRVNFASAAQEISLMSSPRLEVKVDHPGSH